jgi:hypothetical protein
VNEILRDIERASIEMLEILAPARPGGELK